MQNKSLTLHLKIECEGTFLSPFRKVRTEHLIKIYSDETSSLDPIVCHLLTNRERKNAPSKGMREIYFNDFQFVWT